MKLSEKILSCAARVVKATAGVLLVALLLNACSGKSAEAPAAAVDRYIKATQKGDFKTLYEMDYMPQRQIVFIYRAGDEGRQAQLDENFKKAKASFDETTTLVGFTSAWAEKFLFIPQTLGDNPTSKYREREATIVEVAVEYTDQAKAPQYADGSIKKATYEVKLMPLSEIVKGLKTSRDENAWIVRSIDVKNDSITYW